MMYQGKTLTALAAEIERQSALKQDYVVDTRELTLLNGRELILPLDASTRDFTVTQIAHRQIGSRLKIPATYYDRLRQSHPTLLDTNVNSLFRAEPERRMVRTFDEDRAGSHDPLVRAFLSDRYRRRDNDEVAQAVLPILGEIPDVKIASAELTDTRLYIKAVAPRIEREVTVGDAVQAGVVIRNSEVGHGALVVQPLVLRLICLNGMVVAEATRSYHVGRTLESDESYKVFSDETQRLDDRAFFAKLADVVSAAVNESRFEQIVAQLREARTGEQIQKPVDAVERLSKRFALTDDEGQSVLAHLVSGGDLSNYGAVQAVTRASQDADSYERASELEVIGGQLLELAGSREWTALAR
jgi:hypothetical protein